MESKKEITLKLTEKEAQWLKALVQNPIGCTPEDEGIDEKEIRNAFWMCLDKEGLC